MDWNLMKSPSRHTTARQRRERRIVNLPGEPLHLFPFKPVILIDLVPRHTAQFAQGFHGLAYLAQFENEQIILKSR
jgi:hypothetical protein